MLSVIVYGKNDSHGYNYHKRIAISLNCIAELLAFEEDEILFVDNSASLEIPTIIEAIADTLTEKAKSHIRVLRYRKCNSFFPKEALLRNIALRRSNPKNKWILSTNSDMIFLPTDQGQSLSSIVAGLPEGYYQLPRFELPENLWESHLNRLSPNENLDFLRKNAANFHLNTTIKRAGYLGFDNMGDFQLIPRKTLLEITGFNEKMDKRFHIDSNLCRRLTLYSGQKPQNLEGTLLAYHCNHSRKEFLSHAKKIPENSWETFVRSVKSPYLLEQQKTWGLNGEAIEEIKLNKTPIDTLGFGESPEDKEFILSKDTFNTLTYSSTKVLPHLVDHFHHLLFESTIGYVGHNQKLLTLLQSQFSIATIENSASLKDFYQKSSLIIFDFGFDKNAFDKEAVHPKHPLYPKLRSLLKEVMHTFLKIVHIEKKLRKNKKLIGINVLFTDYSALFHHHLANQKTTHVSSISYGYVKKKKQKIELKFLLMYLTLRSLYNYTDRVRQLCYRTFFLRKIFQTK